jgi:hypothetical protein
MRRNLAVRFACGPVTDRIDFFDRRGRNEMGLVEVENGLATAGAE